VSTFLFSHLNSLNAQIYSENLSKDISIYFRDFLPPDSRFSKWKVPITAIILDSNRNQIDAIGEFLNTFHTISNHQIFLTKKIKEANVFVVGVDNIKHELERFPARYRQFFKSDQNQNLYTSGIKKGERCLFRMAYSKQREIGAAFYSLPPQSKVLE